MRTPPKIPRTIETMVAVPKRRRVGPTRSAISSVTGRLVVKDVPKFPVSMPMR